MNWQVFSRPEAENDVIEIAAWYDSRSAVLGDRFVEEFLAVLDQLAINPLLHSRRHTRKNIRWRYPPSFPYRVIYEVIEQEKLLWSRRCYMPRDMTESGSDGSELTSLSTPRLNALIQRRFLMAARRDFISVNEAVS